MTPDVEAKAREAAELERRTVGDPKECVLVNLIYLSGLIEETEEMFVSFSTPLDRFRLCEIADEVERVHETMRLHHAELKPTGRPGERADGFGNRWFSSGWL
jgi:hypothetical protein